MALRLTDAQAAQSAYLTSQFKARQNQQAARLAALVAIYYQRRVNVEDPGSVEAWLRIMIPRIIARSDDSAREAAAFYAAIRAIETGRRATVLPSLGEIDEGVRKSLLAVGPFDYMNKLSEISRLDLDKADRAAMLREAKEITTGKIASAVVRHAQAGGRQTIYEQAAKDETALGWVRVTRAKPCHFCAMLASRGLTYRPYREDSFDLSNLRFTGDGDAKVHDECGCGFKPVFSENDPLVKKTEQFAEMWTLWGAGGGPDAALRFRRGYDKWLDTGILVSRDQVE